MKKLILNLHILLSVALFPSNLHASEIGNDMRFLGDQIATTISRFSKGEGVPFFITDENKVQHVQMLKDEANGRTWIGINHKDVEKVSYVDLKSALLNLKAITTRKLVQIVGDSTEFSPEGTIAAREFIRPYFLGDHIIEYGYTGFMNPTALDINSTLNEWVEENKAQAHRILANVVGHSVKALQEWGCKVSDKPKHFVVVYNDYGMDEGGDNKNPKFTLFGDDVIPSDNIMSAKDEDILVVVEGGAQSFRQAVNVLKNNVRVVALHGVRPKDRELKFFSAATFMGLVKAKLESSKDATTQDIRDLAGEYMKTLEPWNQKKQDAATKQALFESSMKEFIEGGVYKKLLALVSIKQFKAVKEMDL